LRHWKTRTTSPLSGPNDIGWTMKVAPIRKASWRTCGDGP